MTRQGAVRREWRALVKDCNAVLASMLRSLRAGREAVARGVAPLGKDSPFPAQRALRSTASRPAEHVKINWKGYSVFLPINDIVYPLTGLGISRFDHTCKTHPGFCLIY